MKFAPQMLIILLAAFHGTRTASAQVEQPIFDGQTLTGWTMLDGQPVTKGWEVVNGEIRLDTSGGRSGHIVTDREYGDFDLQFEWKIAPGGNSGIKYRVRQFDSSVLGCEYQILDDAGYRKKLRPKGLSGSLYDVYEPSSQDLLKPAGEYNHGRIIVCGAHIEHWLNGNLVVSADVGSSEWIQRIAASKFANVAGFGENHFGKIMLTDHGSEVWYRNIELRNLEPRQSSPPTSFICRPNCRSGVRAQTSVGGLFNLFNIGRSRCR